MKRMRSRVALSLLCLSMAGVAQAGGPASHGPAKVQVMTWPDLLLPEMRNRAIYTPPPVDELDREAGSLAGLQPPSMGVRKDLDGRMISIPGFVVPLKFDAQHRVTSFFLVPYFGACIHFPPPPPEQMIYVVMPSGFELKSMYDAFTLTGQIKVGGLRNVNLGTSSYTMTARSIAPYTP